MKRTGALIAGGLALPFCFPAAALEFSPGDYEMLPANKSLLLAYFQLSHSDALYSQGKKVPGKNRLQTEATLLRFIHGFRPQDNLSIEPQIIVPLLRAEMNTPFTDKASGAGDIILGVPFKFTPGTSGRDTVSLAPFVYAPTGAYDPQHAINIGENRWRYLLQGVWIHHFRDKWALESGADVSWTRTNNHYGPDNATLRQSPRYEYQAYISYQLTPATRLGAGGGWVTGAESSVNGTRQQDRLNSRYIRLSASYFLTPSVQLQLSGGRDLKVEQGFRQDSTVSVRLGMLF